MEFNMKSEITRLSLAVLFAMFCSSCSYITMRKPDRLDRDVPVCVSNDLAPAVDTVNAVSGAVGAASFAIIGSNTGVPEPAVVGTTVGMAIGSIVVAASAASGFQRADACREIKTDYFSDQGYSPPTASYDSSPAPTDARGNAEADRAGEAKPNPETRRGARSSSVEKPEEEPEEQIDRSKYMSVIEAAMHCGSSRRDIWDKIETGTFEKQTSDEGALIPKEEVRDECGEEPEVSSD
jgi:hypothetical protein